MSGLINLDSKIAIIGAGIGGLTLALALAKNGARDVHLYERRADAQELGAGIQIGPNAVRLLEHLGLAEGLRAISVTSPTGSMFEGKTHSKLTELPMDVHAMQHYGAHSYQVLRADLHRLLLDATSDAFGQNPVQFSKELVGLSHGQQPNIAFADGTEEAVDLVVGADGVESNVRSSLFEHSATTYSGYYAWRGLLKIDLSSSYKTVDRLNVWVDAGRHLIAYPVGVDGKWINLVGVSESLDWHPESAVEERPVSEWLEDYSGWNPQALGLIEGLERCQKWSLRTMPVMNRWHLGSVGLLGDAAHPMLPSLAQGAAQAIEDAVCLAGLISAGELSVDALFSTYYDRRNVRVARVQAASHWNLKFFHRPHDMMAKLQNIGMKATGGLASRIIAKKYRWLYGD